LFSSYTNQGGCLEEKSFAGRGELGGGGSTWGTGAFKGKGPPKGNGGRPRRGQGNQKIKLGAKSVGWAPFVSRRALGNGLRHKGGIMAGGAELLCPGRKSLFRWCRSVGFEEKRAKAVFLSMAIKKPPTGKGPFGGSSPRDTAPRICAGHCNRFPVVSRRRMGPRETKADFRPRLRLKRGREVHGSKCGPKYFAR